MDEQDHSTPAVEAEHNFDEISLDFDELINEKPVTDEVKESIEEDTKLLDNSDLFDDFGDFDE